MKHIQNESLAAGEDGDIILGLSVILNCLNRKDKKKSSLTWGYGAPTIDSHHGTR
jgi:hypothetical protein